MIVTVPELTDYMSDVTLTPAQIEAAENVIAGVQSDIENFLNRKIEIATVTETVTTDWDGYAFLENTPVVSVASVTYNGGACYYTLEGTSIYTGLIRVPIIVTYSGGLDGAKIPAIKLAVLRVASREVQNLHDDTLSVKDFGTNDTSLLPEGLQPSEEKRLNRFRRRTVV